MGGSITGASSTTVSILTAGDGTDGLLFLVALLPLQLGLVPAVDLELEALLVVLPAFIALKLVHVIDAGDGDTASQVGQIGVARAAGGPRVLAVGLGCGVEQIDPPVTLRRVW